MDRDDSFDLKPGDVLAGKFRIEQVLGIGGMGMVASAWHLELRTRVALKVLLPSALADAAALERFAREASTVSSMRSEYVVRVFDVGKLPDGGPPYIVMEHLEGEDLESLLAKRGPLEIAEAVGFITEACEGIAEAHSLGIIHRDVKPANLFLTKRVDGSTLLKVVDFGIAKQRGGEVSTTLTGPLITMGSPQYMSPEQTRAARDVKESTDLWSLGVCLYEMLTGARPFSGPSVAEVTAAVLMAEPKSPSELRPEIPRGLAEVVTRCLRKRPWERFPDVAALAAALEPFAPASRRGAAQRIEVVLRSGHAVVPDRHALSAASASERGREVSPPAAARRDVAMVEAPSTRQLASRKVAIGLLVLVGVVGLVAVAVRWRATNAQDAATPSASSETSPMASSAAEGATNDDPPLGIPVSSARSAATARSRSHAAGAAHPVRKPGAGIARTFPESDPPAPAPAPAPPPTTAAPPPTAAAPSFVLASAHVEIGAATNTVGTTAANVNRAIGPLADRMNACYRAALPQMKEPLGGAGMLHIETDEDGVITSARVGGGITGPSSCIAAAASGRRLPNVDTGRARADVPLRFKAQ